MSKHCPECGLELTDESACTNCEKRFDENEIIVLDICPECGEEALCGDTCLACKKFFDDSIDDLYEDYDNDKKNNDVKKKELTVIGIIIAVTILIIGISFINSEPVSIPESSSNSNATNSATTKEPGNGKAYYSFLKKSGNCLFFDTKIEQFIENYNRIKKEYDKYSDIDLSDFSYMSSEQGKDGSTWNIYSCPQTILGRNDGIRIFVETKSKTGEITGISLGVKEHYIFESSANVDKLKKLEMQYYLLIRAAGVPEAEADSIIKELNNNEAENGSYSTYRKGLALYFHTISEIGYYRIIPMTSDEAQT